MLAVVTTFFLNVQRHVLYTSQGFSCRGRQMLAASPPPCPFCRAARRVTSHQTPILGGGLECSTIPDGAIFVQKSPGWKGCVSRKATRAGDIHGWCNTHAMLSTRRRSGAQSLFCLEGGPKYSYRGVLFLFNSPLETVCRTKILERHGRAQRRESLFLQTGNRLLMARDGARLGSATPPNHPLTSVMIEPLAFRGRSETAYGGFQGMPSAYFPFKSPDLSC